MRSSSGEITRRRLLRQFSLAASLTLAGTLTVARPGHALVAKGDQLSAADFVVSLVERARQPLSPSEDSAARRAQLRQTILDVVDIDGIGRRALAAERWDVLDDRLRERYTAAYRSYFFRIVERYFDPSREFEFNVLGSRRIDERDSFVATRIMPSGGTGHDLYWYVRSQPKNTITDIAADGVLLSVSHRREIDNILDLSSGDLTVLPDAVSRLWP